MGRQLLNIGCGATFHPDWVNLDRVSSSPHIQAYDIRKGLPYPDQSFQVCYHSHVLEHLSPEGAQQLLAECWRVLQPHGILRVVVPDLEAIAITYLQLLQAVTSGDAEAEANYDWMMLELYDQVARQESGGAMLRYLQRPHLPNQAFIRARIGQEAESLWQPHPAAPPSLWAKLTAQTPHSVLTKVRARLAKMILRLIAGRDAVQSLEMGQFRDSGEVHQWMYDRFSLGRLLNVTGFVEVRVCGAATSQIEGFGDFGLDVLDGQVRKPDSLFMEARKPA